VDPYEIRNIPELRDDSRVLNNWTDLESPAWLATTNSTVFIQLHSNPTGRSSYAFEQETIRIEAMGE